MLVGTIVLLSAAKCGGKGYITAPIPGTAQATLQQVDGAALPAAIVSTSDVQITVVSGTATLGEAIASGQYLISVRRVTPIGTTTSKVSGTVGFAWSESTVAAAIDLGAGLGTHTFTFARN
jgi:hypothetical protein